MRKSNRELKIGNYVLVVNPQPTKWWEHVKGHVAQIVRFDGELYILRFFKSIKGVTNGHSGTVYAREEIEWISEKEALARLI